MRNIVLAYCRALEEGDYVAAAAHLDPQDLRQFWQSMCDTEAALTSVGEENAAISFLGQETEVQSLRALQPLELMEAFLRQAVGQMAQVSCEVQTVDELSSDRGIAVYTVDGFSNTLDLVKRSDHWYVKLGFGLEDMARSFQERVRDFKTRQARDHAEPVEGELELVSLYGFADAMGHMRIEPRFSRAEGFSEGLAAVKLVTLWGYIDVTGTVVIPGRFRRAHSFSEGLAWVVPASSGDDLYGLIDKTGAQVLAPRFVEVDEFSEGLAAAREGRFWGYIDKTGEWIITPRFQFAEAFSEGLAEVGDEHGVYQYIDPKGQPLDPG